MTDYNAPAELFPGRNGQAGRTARYRRFPSLAEAVRYAVEDLPISIQLSSLVEAEEVRYDGKAIKGLYDSEDYPLSRSVLG